MPSGHQTETDRLTGSSSSVNCLDCSENLIEFDYLRTKVFRKVLEGSMFCFHEFSV